MTQYALVTNRPIRPWLFKLVWYGVFFTYAQYSFIVYMMQKQGGVAPENAKMMTTVFAALGTAALIAGVCLKKYFFSQGWVRRFLEKQEQISSGHVPGMPPDEKTLARLLQITFPLYLMSLGLVHTCVVFGLVSSVMLRNASAFLPFLVATVFGTLLCYPDIREFMEESSMA